MKSKDIDILLNNFEQFLDLSEIAVLKKRNQIQIIIKWSYITSSISYLLTANVHFLETKRL